MFKSEGAAGGPMWRCAAPWQAAVLLLLAMLGGGCASVSSTQAGAVGIERKQYFEDGVREAMVEAAATRYDGMLRAALRHGALNADAPATQRVVAIANRLIPQVTHFRPEARDWAWEVNVLSLDEVNASCMAGGKISVYTGLLQALQPTDDELAAVIGHEIAHALRDHSAETYSTRRRNTGVASGLGAVLSVGIAVATGVNVSRSVGAVSRAGAEAFANLPNSREQEAESDRIGLELMARAGYDPAAASSLWRKFAALSGRGGDAGGTAGGAKAAAEDGSPAAGSFWSTHPSDAERLADLGAHEPRVRPLYLAARAGASRDSPPAAAVDAPAPAVPAATPATVADTGALRAAPPAARPTPAARKRGDKFRKDVVVKPAVAGREGAR